MRNFMTAFLVCVLAYGCRINSGNDKTPSKILFVVSNQHFYKNTDINTSNHFAEIVLAYDAFAKAGYEIDFVSPKGGAIPIGYINTSDKVQKTYLYDSEFMDLLKNTYGPSAIIPSNYKAVYYSGGGAAMFGVPENEKIQNISTAIYNNKGIISAVCHGTAGIVNLKDENGNSLYQNKRISGYPDLFERKEAEYYKTFPFSIEQAITKHKGKFMYSKKPRDNYSVVDGRFVTGQDPSASASVAKKVIKVIENQKLDTKK